MDSDLSGLTITAPGPTDAAALAELKASTFRESFADANHPEEFAKHVVRAFAVEVVARELADAGSTHAWVLDDGYPVAYLKLNWGAAQTESGLDTGLEIQQVYARRSHQGLGLGRRLLDHAVQVAQTRSFPFLWLGVWEQNTRSIAFYEHYGFEVFGEHEFLLGDERQTDLLMRLPVTSEAPSPAADDC